MAYLDIIVFALVAAVLIFKLRAILGRRNDGEEQRPNPFSAPSRGAGKDKKAEKDDGARDGNLGDDEENVIRSEKFDRPRALPAFKAAPESLIGGIEAITAADPSFDEKAFLAGARSAFGMIVSAFAAGELKVLKPLLSSRVFAQFEQAVQERQKAGERQETEIKNIRDADLARAKLEGTRALLTVKYVSDQINVTRDAAGNVVAGLPGKAEEVEDSWTFARDVKSGDPNWLLVETRS
ncbi:MAG: Tim44/TimA family putative adaptor protein [Alphaproteobacteria bacterium]|nr:Tim44/TimA family putative adaptor protein [Alphaproteobacteria bacterium]